MKGAYSVSQVNAYVKNMFAQDYLLSSILVRGEVSNLTYHHSGHIYFTLKDASGTLSCVMFAGRRRGLSFTMREGDQVLVAGSVEVFERDGKYQLYANQIRLDGVGLLNEKYEQLKRRLEEQGMFDEQYKQPVPKFIRTLGVVTAPTGAAVRDIISITKRRNPYVQVILYPALVQGEGAAESIVNGIHALEQLDVDVMIIGRGGGSLEDLWAFNEEVVAQAVFDCSVPIISAVGHETDTVITDYVADLRAPTPSAAAELAVYEYRAFTEELLGYRQSLERQMSHQIALKKAQAAGVQRQLALGSPGAKLREKRMLSVSLEERLSLSMNRKLEMIRRRLPDEQQLTILMQKKLSDRKHTMQLLSADLESRSPLTRLSGGYGFLTVEDGTGIRSIQDVHTDEKVSVRLRDGSFHARVTDIQPLEM